MFEFDLQLFGTAPSTELTTVMIGKESSYGTAATPTVSLISSDTKFDGVNTLVTRDGARQRIGQTEQLTGVFQGKGSLQVELDGDTAGSILYPTMGSEAVAASTNNPTAEAVSTTTTTAVGIGFFPVTPASMTNIVKGQSLTIDTSTNAETVVVRAVSTTQFWAYFTKTHASGVTVTNAAVVDAYTHTFTLASPRPSLTAQINDIVVAKDCFGAKVQTFSIKVQPRTLIEATVGFLYQGELKQTSPVSPTYSTLRGLVFETPGNAATWQGVALDQSIQGLTIDINTGLIAEYPRFGQGRYQGALPETQTVVKASLDLAFEYEDMLDAFWGNLGATGPQGDVLPGNLTLTLVGVDMINTALPYSLEIIIPMAKPAQAPLTRKMKDYIKQTVSFETSESTNGAGNDISFVLTNANSGASL